MQGLKVKKISDVPQLYLIGDEKVGYISICKPFPLQDFDLMKIQQILKKSQANEGSKENYKEENIS